MKPTQHLVISKTAAEKKTALGLGGAPAPMRDLSTIAFIRAVALLRRHGPVPGILISVSQLFISERGGPAQPGRVSL